jgi:DNA repair protein SbcC/Rad50
LEARWNTAWNKNSEHGEADQRIQQEFRSKLSDVRTRLRTQDEHLHQVQKDFKHQCEELERAVEAGDAKRARAANAELLELLAKEKPNLNSTLLARQHAAAEPFKKLIEWQRWSNNQQRVVLCDEIAALRERNPHPDALASAIKEARIKFQALDAAEGLDVDAAKKQGLAKRFNALAGSALKPAKQFFAKRDEMRERKSSEWVTHVEQIEVSIAAASSVKELLASKTQLQNALTSLDQVDGANRAELGRKIRALMEHVRVSIDKKMTDIEAAKTKLVHNLARSVQNADTATAVDAAKKAQRAWEQLGSGKRQKDQEQWLEFRALVDPLFAKLNAEAQAVNAASVAQRAALQACLDSYSAAASAEDTASLHRSRTELNLQRRALDGLSRDDERKLDQAANALDQAIKTAALRERAASFTQSIDEARARLVASETQSEVSDALILQAELAAEIASPEQFRAARMNLQLNRLANRGKSAAKEPSIEELFDQWLAISTQPLDQFLANAGRWRVLFKLE